jgi:hemolysin III
MRIVSFSVYGLTLILLYLFSTLYHSLRGRTKRVFQVLDHHAIYLLIAGTYTPFCLVALGGAIGWWLFGAIWGLALLGIVIDTLRGKGGSILSVVIYTNATKELPPKVFAVAVKTPFPGHQPLRNFSCIGIFDHGLTDPARPRSHHCCLASGRLPTARGGWPLLYTVGVIFYALDQVRPWCHGIWHLFVLAGSVSHYFAILLYM